MRTLAADFARELNELRDERHATWEQIARRAGISRSYLRDIAGGRTGQGVPSERVVVAIAQAFEVAPDHFRITRARAVLASPQAIDAVYARLSRVA